MASKSGIGGLKCIQWLFRGLQFICCVIVLGVTSYFLASLIKSNMTVSTNVKAIEGISAVGTLYTILGMLLVCCCAGFPATSFIAMILDIGLAGAMVYVAIAYKAGASSCSGSNVDTVYGTGDASATPGGSSSFIKLPTFSMACRLETAGLAAACVASLFFLLSILLEFKMNRNRHRASRPVRDADGQYINKSDWSGPPPQRRDEPRGFLGAFRRQNTYRGTAMQHPDMLPSHQQPNDYSTRQIETWGEVESLHSSDELGGFNEARHVGGPPVRFTPTTAPRPAADTYTEGELDDAPAEYNLYREDERGNDLSETGKRNHKESKAAKLDRFAAA